ncbi:anti-sigma factor [Catalinimonas sp. 4WD22]|uniref:anti-sigma factor n=1 Tax=Catalinimonas locisalis TaxID=3133978 RepID=UPI003101B061
MNIEDYISSGILEQYVLGELSSEEEEEVLRYAKRYPEVQREIFQIEESVEHLARSVAIKPPRHVLDQIQEKVSAQETEAPPAKKSKKINTLRYGVAATFTLKLVAMAIAAHFWINWQNSENRLEQLQSRYDQLEQKTQQLSQAFAIVSNPDFQSFVLKSDEAALEAQPIVYWNENTGELYLNTAQLPASDAAHQYQLWAIAEGNAQSLGVFDVSPGSFPQMIAMPAVENVNSFLLTLEKEGGSSQPSSEGPHYTVSIC